MAEDNNVNILLALYIGTQLTQAIIQAIAAGSDITDAQLDAALDKAAASHAILQNKP